MDKTRANRARAVQIEHKSRLVKHHAEQEVALYGSGWLDYGAQNRRIADLLRAMRANGRK